MRLNYHAIAAVTDRPLLKTRNNSLIDLAEWQYVWSTLQNRLFSNFLRVLRLYVLELSVR